MTSDHDTPVVFETGGRRAGKTERMKKRMEGFQKPLTGGPTKKVSMPIISEPEAGLIVCSCGWRFVHARPKVREDRAETHTKNKHGGAALWM